MRITWHSDVDHLLPYARSRCTPCRQPGRYRPTRGEGRCSWKEPSPCPRGRGAPPRRGESRTASRTWRPARASISDCCEPLPSSAVSRSSGRRRVARGTPLRKARWRYACRGRRDDMASVTFSAPRKEPATMRKRMLLWPWPPLRAGGPVAVPGPPAHAQRVFQAAGPTAASIQARSRSSALLWESPTTERGAAAQRSPRDQLGRWGSTATTDPVTPFDVFLDSRGAGSPRRARAFHRLPRRAAPGWTCHALRQSDLRRHLQHVQRPRLFTPVDSRITEGFFFVPGTNGCSQRR